MCLWTAYMKLKGCMIVENVQEIGALISVELLSLTD